jgi:hypothetical protein
VWEDAQDVEKEVEQTALQPEGQVVALLEADGGSRRSKVSCEVWVAGVG